MAGLVKSHLGEIASVVTILSFLFIGFQWVASSVHKDVEQIRQDNRETNKRIDALYHYVLTNSDMK